MHDEISKKNGSIEVEELLIQSKTNTWMQKKIKNGAK